MQKQHRAVERVRNRTLCLKLRAQQFLESPFSFHRNTVDGAHAAARHALASYRGNEAGFGELTNRVIERADVDIGIALDHGVAEAPLDLVGIKRRFSNAM